MLIDPGVAKTHPELADYLQNGIPLEWEGHDQIGLALVKFGGFHKHVVEAAMAFVWGQYPLVEVGGVATGFQGQFTSGNTSVQLDTSLVQQFESFQTKMKAAKGAKATDALWNDAIRDGTAAEVQWVRPGQTPQAKTPYLRLSIVLLTLLVAWGWDFYGRGGKEATVQHMIHFQEELWVNSTLKAPVTIKERAKP